MKNVVNSKRFYRLLSVLIVIMLMNCNWIMGFAKNNERDLIEAPNNLSTGFIDKSLYDLDIMPEVMKGNISLNDVEKRTDNTSAMMNVVSYQMKNGQQQMQVFPIDVKYVDADGITRDKSNKLYAVKSNVYSFETKDNDILSRFALNVSDGIITTYGKHMVKLYPLTSMHSEALLIDNSITYIDAFERGVSLQYQPTFTGYKENIIINNQTATTEYRFAIQTNGLSLRNINGKYSLLDNGLIVAELGAVEIYDSSGKFILGSMKSSEITEDELYIITVCVPKDFLMAEDTQYPVIVDPTLVFPANSLNFDIVASVTGMYGGMLTKSSILPLGYQTFSEVNNAVIKFSGLMNLLRFYGDRISSIYLDVFNATTYSDTTNGYLYLSPTVTNWEIDSYASGNLYSAYDSSILKRTTIRNNMSVGSVHSFNIKSLTNLWLDGEYLDSSGEPYGIHIYLSNSSANIQLYGTLANNVNYLPRIRFNLKAQEVAEIQSGAIYKLSAMGGNGVLQCSGINNVQFSADDLNNPNQLFKFVFNGSYYNIIHLGTGKYLASDGTTPYLTNSYDINTQWFIISSGYYYDIVDWNGKYLSVGNGNFSLTVYRGTYWSFRFFSLDITPAKQETGYSCSSASIRILLRNFDIYMTESSVIAEQKEINNSEWNWVHVIRKTINKVLAQNLISMQYNEYDLESNMSESDYRTKLMNNLNQGIPLIVNINVLTSGELPSNSGHYVVIKGLYQSYSNGKYYVIVNDPNNKVFSWGYTENEKAVLLSTFLSYQQAARTAGNGMFICVE